MLKIVVVIILSIRFRVKKGYLFKGGHVSGFQINPGTKAKMYNNIVKNGTGSAFFIKGDGVEIFNNVVNSAKNAVEAYDNLTSSDSRYKIYNNTFVNLKKSGIAMINASFTLNENFFYNNILHTIPGVSEWGYKKTDAFILDNIKNNIITKDISSLDFIDVENGDLRLSRNSILAINKGDCTINSLRIDILGESRIKEGKRCDIGAYEYIDFTLSITNEFNETINVIYPNPIKSSNFLTLVLKNEPDENTFITIFSITGKQVLKEKLLFKESDVILGNQLSTGIYLVKVSNAQGGGTRKIFIE